MMKIELLRLLNLFISSDKITFNEILELYSQPHRYYHNFNHIENMINNSERLNKYIRNYLIESDKYNYCRNLLYAIIFHDIIYEVGSTTNEEDSAEFFKKNTNLDSYSTDLIYNAILATKTHSYTKDSSWLTKELIKLDLYNLYSNNISKLLNDERNIFLEYQKYKHEDYKLGRIKVLYDFQNKYRLENNEENNKGIQFLINYVHNRKLKIGVYAGSFNPFHKGHLNILQKAEQIFDKVIIARGHNPEKNQPIEELPSIIKNREIINYDGLLTDFLNTLNQNDNYTLIRGLRNTTDLQYELTQSQYLKDFKPNIQIINIVCDKEYEHISSTAIRQLKNYNKDVNYLI